MFQKMRPYKLGLKILKLDVSLQKFPKKQAKKGGENTFFLNLVKIKPTRTLKNHFEKIVIDRSF